MTERFDDVTVKISRPTASETVSAGLARTLLEFAVRNGANSVDLLSAAGLNAGALTDDDVRIPFARYAALYRAAERLCSDPAFAIHLGESVDGMDLLVCHVGSATETLGDALAMINRYNRLAVDVATESDGDPFLLEPSREGLWLIDASIYPGGVSQLIETSFVRLIAGTRMISDRQFVRRVHLTRDEPSYRQEYKRVFAAPVRFGQSRNAMLLDPEWTSLPLPSTSQYADTVLETHAERLMERLGARAHGQAVEELVAERLGAGTASMPAVARALGMSRPALYRALRAEGSTFEEIAARCRKERASQLLGEGHSIAETAAQLGFSDRSAFARAFKRWTGMSPGAVAAQPRARRL